MIHATTQRTDFNAVKDKLRAAEKALAQSSTVHDARLREVFRERAERLAASHKNVRSNADAIPVLAFRAGAEVYGVELRCVAQVFPDTPITPVPGAQETLLGIATLQGEVRSILGIRQLLSLPGDDGDTNHYILLLRHDGRKVGLRVEQIEGVRQVANDSVTAANDVADQSARYVQGLTRDNLVLLRTAALFEALSCPQNQQLTARGAATVVAPQSY